MPRSLAKWLLPAAAALFMPSLASAAYQAAAEATDRRRYPPTGRMIDVGDRSLHLLDMGTTLTIRYDRRGRIQSNLGWKPRRADLEAIVSDAWQASYGGSSTAV